MAHIEPAILMDRVVAIERAKSGRSRCVTASWKLGKRVPIALGEMRIGVKVWMGGHSTVVWQKAASFLEWGCGLEYAKTGAATCKITGEKISKDALRLKIHNGPPPAAYYVSFDASAELIQSVLCAADAPATALSGFDDLQATEQAAVRRLTPSQAARKAFWQAHPHPCEGGEAPAASSRKKVAAPTRETAVAAKGKQAKRQRGGGEEKTAAKTFRRGVAARPAEKKRAAPAKAVSDVESDAEVVD